MPTHLEIQRLGGDSLTPLVKTPLPHTPLSILRYTENEIFSLLSIYQEGEFVK